MKIQVCITIILLSAAFYVVNGQPKNIAVEKIDGPKLEQLLNNRNGKVLFINLWATWCIPCREEFPWIIKLVKEFKDKPIDFYGISTDYPDEVGSKIIPFLVKQNVNFINFVNGYKEDEDLINAFDKDWNGALPATFIFDKYGKKISFLEGKQSFHKFKSEIEKAMEE